MSRARRLLASLTVTLSLLAVGCGISSTYVREEIDPQEIQWSVRGGRLTAVQGASEVGHEASWKHLPPAVSCVEAARPFATKAADYSFWGEVLLWTGFGVGALSVPAGLVTGTIAFLVPVDASGGGPSWLIDPAQRVGTVTTATWLVGALAAFATSYAGVSMVSSSTPLAMDAINSYNDSYRESAACAAPK